MDEIRQSFGFMADAANLQDRPNTLVVSVAKPSGPVKLSFFGRLGFERIADPQRTRDGTLLVASFDDLLAA